MVDLWFQNFPRGNFSDKKSRFYHKDFEPTGIAHSLKKIYEDDYNEENLNLLVVELIGRGLDLEDDLFKIKDFIDSNPSLRIVFYYPSEGFTRDYEFRRIVHRLTESVRNFSNRVCFVFGDHNVEKSYDDYLAYKHWDKRMDVFSFDYFRYETLQLYPKVNLLERKYKEIKYDFLCLNRVARYNRIALYVELKRLGYVDKNLYSYYNIENQSVEPNNLSKAEFLLNKYYAPLVKESLDDKIMLDSIVEHDVEPYLTDERLYKQSFFSLVTETEIDNLFITEKTWKPLIFGHPFIIWGSQGILDYLRSKGFKTYNGIFDETYDTIVDNRQRLNAIVQEVERFSNLPSEVKKENFLKSKEIARHNQDVMLNLTDNDYLNSWNNLLLGMK